MTPAQRQYLDAMGIQVWQSRGTVDDSAGRAAVAAPEILSAGAGAASGDVSQYGWPELRAAVAACTACPLHASRKRTVFGVGATDANWMFIGEAPGADEDAQGEPFVGRAGQLLNAMLVATGRRRESVFIANTLKCRPPGNRDPKPEEARSCAHFLHRQIEMIEPRVIVALGRIAAQRLLQTNEPLGRLRGRNHSIDVSGQTFPVVVTYHPAYLLRSPREKRKAWEDLLRIISLSP